MTKAIHSMRDIQTLLAEQYPTLNDVAAISEALPVIIGDSITEDLKELVADLSRLVHIAKLALVAHNNLPQASDKQFSLRQGLLAIATKCIERADFIGTFDETDDWWMSGPNNIYEYTITLKQEDGTTTKEVLVGTDDAHAREEASYECEGEIIAVERGEFLHKND